ncbi:PREDICTED: origin recognition complex subunit 5-like [Acropora digitifera]|uniref:origin recognition complex subunit 5-like n=1 Tax=Acropora digitifera TaxID=70779 RepID=UPI00077A14FF|nr:PREDICTED: origin recognition complex subunit 5-like [Acropora digitifera]
MAAVSGLFNEEILQNVYSKISGRKPEVKTLLTLFGPRSSYPCPAIFICGHTATGKSFVVQTLLQEMQLPHVTVNCVETFTARLIYEHILYLIQDIDQQAKSNVPPKCDNMTDFIRQLKIYLSSRNFTNETFFIVLDKAERLRDMEAFALPAFLRLQELTQLNICVVLLSQIVWEKFQVGTGFYEPVSIHFPDYCKAELLQIMEKDCPSSYPVEFYKAYCQLLASVFYSVCRDLNELRYLAILHFSKYCEPVDSGEAELTDIRKLWRNIEPHLKKALNTVYLREISSDHWQNVMGQNTLADSDSQEEQGLFVRSHIELPFYTKYLLIAAYLASYNPAHTDKRFFTKQGKRGLSNRAKAAAKGKKSNTQLTGPKNFPLDRLMAIFYSIVEDNVVPSASILCQISSLVSLNLLAQVTSDDQIDCPKYKCLVNFQTICDIAKQLKFEIMHYLYDFV